MPRRKKYVDDYEIIVANRSNYRGPFPIWPTLKKLGMGLEAFTEEYAAKRRIVWASRMHSEYYAVHDIAANGDLPPVAYNHDAGVPYSTGVSYLLDTGGWPYFAVDSRRGVMYHAPTIERAASLAIDLRDALLVDGSSCDDPSWFVNPEPIVLNSLDLTNMQDVTITSGEAMTLLVEQSLPRSLVLRIAQAFPSVSHAAFGSPLIIAVDKTSRLETEVSLVHAAAMYSGGFDHNELSPSADNTVTIGDGVRIVGGWAREAVLDAVRSGQSHELIARLENILPLL